MDTLRIKHVNRPRQSWLIAGVLYRISHGMTSPELGLPEVCGRLICNWLISKRFKNRCPQTCQKKRWSADWQFAIYSQSIYYKTITRRPLRKARNTRRWHCTNAESKHLERSDGGISRPAGPGIWRRRSQIRKGFKAAGGSGESYSPV